MVFHLVFHRLRH